MVNPAIIPGISKVITKPGQNAVLMWQYIVTKKHVKKNRPRHLCIEDPGYDFLVCVKQSLAEKVGCKPEWENLSNFSDCKSVEQLHHYYEEYYDLSYMETREIIDLTNCKFPCAYKVSKGSVPIKKYIMFRNTPPLV